MTQNAMREGAQDDGKAARAANANQKWSIIVTKEVTISHKFVSWKKKNCFTSQ